MNLDECVWIHEMLSLVKHQSLIGIVYVVLWTSRLGKQNGDLRMQWLHKQNFRYNFLGGCKFGDCSLAKSNDRLSPRRDRRHRHQELYLCGEVLVILFGHPWIAL